VKGRWLNRVVHTIGIKRGVILKKTVWLVMSWLVVMALVMASCGPAEVEQKAEVGQKGEVEEEEVVGEEEEEEVVGEEEVAAPGEPQYGGTLTAVLSEGARGWDPAHATHSVSDWATMSYERLGMGDIEGAGPRGENLYGFHTWYWPLNFYKLQLAESYDLPDDKTLIIHLRKGIHFQNKPPVDGREVDAEDVALSFTRLWNVPRFKTGYMSHVASIEAVDKYTVKVTFDPRNNFKWVFWFVCGWYNEIYPRELVEQDLVNDWEYVCGTGPFILKDYLSDVGGTFVRNPDYWGTTTINGKEYQLPFVDRLQVLIIPEISTRTAAFRTGKLYRLVNLIPDMYEEVKRTCSGVEWIKYCGQPDPTLSIRCDIGPPFDDIKVRRALLMAVDWDGLIDTVYGGEAEKVYQKLIPPGWDPEMGTPVDELPAEIVEARTYNPEKAKQLLAEAGYPEGFKAVMDTISTNAVFMDDAAYLLGCWEKIGVDVTLNAMEFQTFSARMHRGGHSPLNLYGEGNPPFTAIDCASRTSTVNASRWSAPGFEELRDEINLEMDPAKMKVMMKELSIIQALGFNHTTFAAPQLWTVWWPWAKNYYGEAMTGHSFLTGPLHARVWIDQELKGEMGH